MRCDVLDDFFVCRCQLQLISIKASIITPIHKFAIVVASTHFTIEFGTSPHFHPKLSCFFFFKFCFMKIFNANKLCHLWSTKCCAIYRFFFFFTFPLLDTQMSFKWWLMIFAWLHFIPFKWSKCLLRINSVDPNSNQFVYNFVQVDWTRSIGMATKKKVNDIHINDRTYSSTEAIHNTCLPNSPNLPFAQCTMRSLNI